MLKILKFVLLQAGYQAALGNMQWKERGERINEETHSL